MIAGLQLIGILFGVVMLYLSYVYYKKNTYTQRSFVLWGAVWVIVVIIFAAPQITYGLLGFLKIERTADLLTAVSLVFLTTIVFYIYSTVKQLQRKMEELVRELATREVKKTKKVAKKK